MSHVVDGDTMRLSVRGKKDYEEGKTQDEESSSSTNKNKEQGGIKSGEEKEDGEQEERKVVGKENVEEKNKEDVGGENTIEEGELSGWKTVSTDKMERSPKTQSLNQDQVNIVTPSRFDALRNTDEKGEEVDTESVEEDMEEEEDIYQSRVEENIESTKKERARQMLPRVSKTNHRVVMPGTSNHIKDMKRGTRKNHK